MHISRRTSLSSITSRKPLSKKPLSKSRGLMTAEKSGFEESQFKSWRQALAQNRLTQDQLAVLEKMVQDGEADSIEAAAARLDWQDTVINPEEHMYGF